MELTTSAFEAARRYERELTPRQREVLALMARGRTNPEIAQALDVTLDGAKWHVSEVLTKLGFTNREEAAAYWRWRNNALVRMRGLAGGLASLAGWRGLAASAGVVSIAGAATWFWAGGDAPLEADRSALYPYHLTAETIFGVAGRPNIVEPEEQWWRTPSEFRSVRGLPGNRLVTVADGQEQSEWSEGNATYQRRAAEPYLGLPPETLGCATVVGPVAAPSFEAMVEVMRRTISGTVRESGTATVAGRAVRVIDVAIPVELIVAPGERRQDEIRCEISVDTEHVFILAVRTTGPEVRAIEVTEVEFGATLDDQTFVFEVPDGVVEGPPTELAIPIAGDAAGVFLHPSRWSFTTRPDGLAMTTWRPMGTDSTGVGIEMHIEGTRAAGAPPPMALLITQLPIADVPVDGVATEPVDGFPAWVTAAPGRTTLTVVTGGLILRLSSPVFTEPELRRIVSHLAPPEDVVTP